jgi:branched-chain amino acid transport system permease protein
MPLPLYYYLAVTAVNVLMTWALYLPYRVAHLHFLPVANMAISAYVAAHLVMQQAFPWGLALAVGFALGFALGLLVSLFVGDAPTFSVVIVGFTFLFITRTVIENIAAFGGPLGLFDLPYIGSSPAAHRHLLLAVLYGLVILVGFLLWRFDHSGLGRAASATFADRGLATSLGVDTGRLGAMLQTASCTVAGGCGVLYGFIYRSLHPDFFGFQLVGLFLTILFVGGYATPWGPVVAAPVLYGIPLLFPAAIAQWRVVVYGVALILVLLSKPDGLVTRDAVRSLEARLRHGGKT